MDYIRIAVELLCGFIALLFLTKLLGKTQITQITAFDFISAIVLGELVGNALYDKETGVGKILFAVGVWGLLIYVTQIITVKFKRTRSLLEGKPSIVIHQGKLIYKELKKNKLDINQLMHLLREKDVFSLREVEFAIIETDGKLTVMKKAEYTQPTKQDLRLPQQLVSLSYILISDGELLQDNLQESGVSESWLQTQIQESGFKEYKDVLVAQWEPGKDLIIQGY